jgi:hypothetical protein
MARSSKSGQVTPANVLRGPSSQTVAKKPSYPDEYTSEGVVDHDVFLLPGSDYQILIGITVLAAVIRLFRIYQPSSVVFDEVQYVKPLCWLLPNADWPLKTASADLHRNTSKGNSSWMSIHLLQNYFLHSLDG